MVFAQCNDALEIEPYAALGWHVCMCPIGVFVVGVSLCGVP